MAILINCIKLINERLNICFEFISNCRSNTEIAQKDYFIDWKQSFKFALKRYSLKPFKQKTFS